MDTNTRQSDKFSLNLLHRSRASEHGADCGVSPPAGATQQPGKAIFPKVGEKEARQLEFR
jgi:hypothetical protein